MFSPKIEDTFVYSCSEWRKPIQRQSWKTEEREKSGRRNTGRKKQWVEELASGMTDNPNSQDQTEKNKLQPCSHISAK